MTKPMKSPDKTTLHSKIAVHQIKMLQRAIKITDKSAQAFVENSTDAILKEVYEEVEQLVDKLPERGFGIPKEGTPSHNKGTFTKLVSSEEFKSDLKLLMEGK